MRITHHRLQITDVQRSLSFYCHKLGMTLVFKTQTSGVEHYFLSFENTGSAMLVLMYDPAGKPPDVSPQPSRTEGYWKFSIAVPSLEQARQQLLASGIAVGHCFEVKGVAYLCHLQDPDGYCIELIQHTFYNPDEDPASATVDLSGASVALNLSTLRVKDIDASLAFYQSLGMSLISRQAVPDRNMTLYFLSGLNEPVPSQNVDAIGIREWLWQRPYTLLELQHIHGTETREDFQYRVGYESGFMGLDIKVPQLEPYKERFRCQEGRVLTTLGEVSSMELCDPDGYMLRLYG